MGRVMSFSVKSVLSGIFSAFIFLVALRFNLGIIFLLLSLLPLFYEGLQRPSIAPILVALGLILLATGLGSMTVYLCLVAFPAYYFVSTSNAPNAESRVPIGKVLSDLCVFGALCVSLVALALNVQGESFRGTLTSLINTAFPDFETRLGAESAGLGQNIALMLLSFSIWLVVLVTYGFAWLAHRMLRKQALRTSLGLTFFLPPRWLLELVAICALAGFIAGPELQFLGNSLFLILMLPYFLVGIAWVHVASKEWPNRGFLLFFMYFSLVTFLGSAAVLVGIGLWQHIKRLSVGKT